MENVYGLDATEIKILQRKMEGRTGRQIARELKRSDAWLSGRMSKICGKMGVTTKPMAVRKAAIELFDIEVEPLFQLTTSEKQVIKLLLEDFTIAQIATQLTIDASQVSDRLYKACKKYGAATREQLATMIVVSEVTE